jgi:hypothetical protein
MDEIGLFVNEDETKNINKNRKIPKIKIKKKHVTSLNCFCAYLLGLENLKK